MNFSDFKEANHTFHKPGNMTDEQCGSLRVHMGVSVDNFPVIVSKWDPSKEDLERLNNGEGIYLTVVGTGTPPVMVTAGWPSDYVLKPEVKHG